MNTRMLFTLWFGVMSLSAHAQMTNINVNGSSPTPAPSVIVSPQAPVTIPATGAYVYVQTQPTSGMTNINLNRGNGNVGSATMVAIPQVQPRVFVRASNNGSMTNININQGGQMVLEPIPNTGAFVILQPQFANTPTIVQTPAPTQTIQTQVTTTPIANTPTVSTPVVSTPVVSTPVVSTPVVTRPSTSVTTSPAPNFAVQPSPGTIQPQAINVEPVRTLYAESRWFGATFPTRNFNTFGLGIRYGIIDLFAPFVDGRFDFDYYAVGNTLEFALNAQFLVASSSSPSNTRLYFDVFTGLGPRLLVDENSTALALGGYIETEMRYGSLAPFIALDASVPIYTFQATGNETTIPRILLGVELGMNFYF